jgi:hypothetical protein
MSNPVRKPFEKHLYDRFDNPAKSALVSLLEAEGHEIPHLKENYYADVESVKDGTVYYSEAEVKQGWESIWPEHWTEIRIPERKTRLLKKYDYNVTFYVFNKRIDKCWRITGEQLKSCEVKEATGKYIRKGEMFFHIPYTEAELVYEPCS